MFSDRVVRMNTFMHAYPLLLRYSVPGISYSNRRRADGNGRRSEAVTGGYAAASVRLFIYASMHSVGEFLASGAMVVVGRRVVRLPVWQVDGRSAGLACTHSSIQQ